MNLRWKVSIGIWKKGTLPNNQKESIEETITSMNLYTSKIVSKGKGKKKKRTSAKIIRKSGQIHIVLLCTIVVEYPPDIKWQGKGKWDTRIAGGVKTALLIIVKNYKQNSSNMED